MTLVKFKKHAPADVMNSFFSDFLNPEFVTFPRNINKATPNVNISETDTQFNIELQVPGFTKEDLKVKLENDVLTISGEVKTETEKTEVNYRRKEFNKASFSRSFSLPDTIDGEKIEAKHDNGILMLALPKKQVANVTNVREINLN